MPKVIVIILLDYTLNIDALMLQLVELILMLLCTVRQFIHPNTIYNQLKNMMYRESLSTN